MDINASVTILWEHNGLKIAVHDEDSSMTLLLLELDAEHACKAMSRLSHTYCQHAEVHSLERVGKTMEHKRLEFPLPCSTFDRNVRSIAAAKSQELCPDGWVSDAYFGSQDSFFTKDGKDWARTTIRRWVEREPGK